MSIKTFAAKACFGFAALALGAGLVSCGAESTDIVIVGAGGAGLTAAT